MGVMDEIAGAGVAGSPQGASSGVDDGLGYDDSASRGERTVLPESCYPVDIQVAGYGPSSQAETPELALHLVVNDGPFAGTEIDKYSSRVYLTPGGPKTKGGMIGMLRHMCHQVTGRYPDQAALVKHGITLTGDPKTHREQFRDQFNGLSKALQLELMAQYLRVDEWNGKRAVAAIAVEYDKSEQYKGQPRNKVANFYDVNHPTHGLAYCRATCFPAQQVERDRVEGDNGVTGSGSTATA